MDVSNYQTFFYTFSPIASLLAVGAAYIAIHRQSMPNILVYYEPSNHSASVIDLVICNRGNGAARDLEFLEAIPIYCWGIEGPREIDKSSFLKLKIPVLAPGKELRYQAGQYGGLHSEVGEKFVISATYKYRNPLWCMCTGEDTFVLDIQYMRDMPSRNSAAQDIKRSLDSIDKKLGKISSKV